MSEEWVHLMIEVPPSDGHALLILLREQLGFRYSTIEPCELTRDDGARVGYGPTLPRQRFYGPTEVEGV